MLVDYLVNPFVSRPTGNTDLREIQSLNTHMVIYALERMKSPAYWTDYPSGWQTLCNQQWEILMGTATERLEGASNRIYALLDSTLNAVPRTGAYTPATGITTFTPPIPAGPGTIAIKALEPRHNESYTEQLAQGLTLDLAATELAEIRALLAAMDAEQTAEDLTEIITRLGAILALL